MKRMAHAHDRFLQIRNFSRTPHVFVYARGVDDGQGSAAVVSLIFEDVASSPARRLVGSRNDCSASRAHA